MAKLLLFLKRAAFVIILLIVGFAAGLPVGQSMGFSSGSEWSLNQAALLAREAGLFMPVKYKEGSLYVVVRQPRYLQKRVRQLADRYEKQMDQVNKGKRDLIDRTRKSERLSIMQ
jgi:hypothetical protein